VAEPFRVLLVEDEPVIRELVAAMLEGEGVKVITCADGAQALKVARAERPDLILLDVVLPGLDGVTLCRLVRADPALSGAAVYMLTAKARASDHDAARRAGCDGYIEKPFKGQELQALVADLRSKRK
jgi:DNA-binding response OmpR family regulator